MRGLVSLAAVTVAVVCQLTIVDRIAFPGGAGPDLVLILVAALALASGPLTGALTGFWAGLALDVAPPGSHFVGQDALVFCLVGYLCGLLADEPSADGVNEPGHTALFEIVVTVAGALCGEALAVLLGVMLSDPRVTWPAITHVLPVAALYDVLACPFVLYAAAAALRLTGTRAGAPKIGAQQIGAKKPGPAPSTPRFRLSGGTAGVRAPAPRREPRLKLGQGSLPGGGLAAFATGGTAAAKVRFSGRRREGVFGGSLLGGSVFRRPAPGFGRGPLNGGTLGKGTPGRATLSRGAFGKGTLGRGTRGGTLGGGTLGGGALGGRTARGTLAPRFSRGGALRRLAGALRRPARPRSPGKGWLRRTSTPTLRRSALGRSTLGRSALGRRRTLNLRMPRQKTAKRRRFR